MSKICLNCRQEYSDSITKCPDCGSVSFKIKSDKENTTTINNEEVAKVNEVKQTQNVESNNKTKYDIMAIIGFILSILSIFGCIIPYVKYFLILPALVLSIIGIAKSNKKVLSIFGLIISLICLGVAILGTIILGAIKFIINLF